MSPHDDLIDRYFAIWNETDPRVAATSLPKPGPNMPTISIR